jgi:hypothetical protein
MQEKKTLKRLFVLQLKDKGAEFMNDVKHLTGHLIRFLYQKDSG